jgi:deazaflavin-dependent oxidoreductase (nitroreductase family)
MAERFLYLTTTGRRTAKPRRIEIWFVEHGGRHYIVSEHREQSHWVQNIEHDAAVTFSVGTREHPEATVPPTRALGRVVRAEEEPALVREVRALMDAQYRWSDGLVVEIGPTSDGVRHSSG